MKIIITERQEKLIEMDISIKRRLLPGIEYIKNLNPKDVCDNWEYGEVDDYVDEVLSDATLSCIEYDFNIYDKVYNYFSNEYSKYVTQFFYNSLCDDVESITESSPSIRRRLGRIEHFLDKLMENMYPCDYDGITHFMFGVIRDAGDYFDDVDDFDGMDKDEFLNVLETDFEEYIYDYYLERCVNNQINEGENKPTNPSLWSRAKSMAKSKFKVYPSAYANGWAAKWYKSKGGGWRKGKKKTNESDDELTEDLRRWFKEKWVDVSKKVDGKHPPCGRKDADGKAYPKCRPSKKVSSETPKVASSYSKEDKKSMTQQKRREEKKDPKIGTGNKPTMTHYKKK
jgi:hypothetical protein